MLDEHWPFSCLQLYCDATVDEDPDLVVDVMIAVGGRMSGEPLGEDTRPFVKAIKDLVPVKVVSERLGHANIAFTIETYQHVLPGMQRDAARTFEALVTSKLPPGAGSNGASRLNIRENTARTR